MKKRVVAIAMGATALSSFMPTTVAAQSTQRRQLIERYDIPAGGLAEALQQWSKVSKRQIIYRMEDVSRRKTNGIHGDYPPMIALQGLLIGTGLKIVTSEDGAVALSPLAEGEADTSTTPEILVTGRLGWSLNTAIERTQDDSQPFIVMDRKEIERSGAPNLEAFLRNQLNVNSSPIMGDQAAGGYNDSNRAVGVSSINLRGIGVRDTLILIDGRRQPGINIGSGDISQPSITGIPISAVERIEVLASSASGIYGSGASGGVINIVLRRDFKGADLSINYSNTTDFAAGNKTVDLVGGVPIEGGRTRISFTGNWTQGGALTYGEREKIRQRGIKAQLANDPYAFYGGYVTVPQGTAVNYKTDDGSMLQLKPQYGGQTLTTSLGTIPIGYAGLQAAGVAPLLASVGKYNLEQPDTASGYGARAPLIYPVDQYSGSLAIRREFSNWLTMYAEVGISSSTAYNTYANTINSYTLNADAPNNPFTQSIAVTFPANGKFDTRVKRVASTFRTLGGAIVKLPWDWQAIAELAYSTSSYQSQDSPANNSVNATYNLQDGTINGFLDTTSFPLSLPYNATPYSNRNADGKASNLAPSLRLAGPLPLTLPGGKVRITANAEINTARIEATANTLLKDDTALTNYIPKAMQNTKSVYAEVMFPLLGGKHQLPLVKLLELRLSARHESYRGDGADPYACEVPTVPNQSDYVSSCPPAGTEIPRSVTSNAHTDPSISLLWTPIDGVTLRGSYTTGYLPPQLNQLVRTPQPMMVVGMRDSARGGEVIGMDTGFGVGIISGFSGGNPNLKPESSKTWTGGVILKPQFLDGFRFSVDWMRLKKRDLYFDPILLLGTFFGSTQAQFDQFLKYNPDRIVRGPASGGFAVGPITSLDISMINLKSMETQAFDFTVNYDTTLFGGTLSAVGRATYVDKLTIAPFADSPATNYAGVATTAFSAGSGAQGSLRFRGSASVQWSKNGLSLGWQTRYMNGYYLLADHSVVTAQGAAKVDGQMYHDMNISYRLPSKMTVFFGINNVFDKMPPLDVSRNPLFYSAYGDPRLRNFYLRLTKSF